MIGDDTQANAVGFALDLKNNPKTLDELTTQYLSEFTKLLKNNGATVNVLVNKISKNSQSDVAHITLELDFNTAQNVRKIRELLISHLNGNVALTTLPATVTDQNVKLRLNLAFWIADQTGFLWANSYSINQATVVNKLYGDLNIATALSSNAPIEIKTVSNEFTQNATGSNAVDILWSIDSSGSMGEEQSNLANGATQFFNTLNKAGIDYRLAATTQDGRTCTTLRTLTDGKTNFIDKNTVNAEAEWKKLSTPGTSGSSTETGFYCVREANLTGFDRTNAKNLVVFLSDEPENETVYGSRPNGTSSTNYTIRSFNDYKDYFVKTGATYFSIVGTGTLLRPDFTSTRPNDPNYSCNGQGGSASGGAHFKEISRLTGGSSASICTDAASWSVVFDEIIKSASGLASSFTLTQTPIPSSVKVTVEGQNVARDVSNQNGFDLIYSNTGTSVVFFGNAIPKANQKVNVEYKYLAK